MADLESENARLREEVRNLRQQLEQLTCKTDAIKATTAKPCVSHTEADGCLSCARDVDSGCSASTSGRTFVAEHNLTKGQVQRYSRHLLLPSFGLQAQSRLCNSSVLLVGCGGLGSPAALYLAAAGLGRLGLVDHDVVESSNLHRQVIHTEDRVGVHKAESARAACLALNSSIQVQVHAEGLNARNALPIISQYDVVLDCSDNPPTRYLVSDACVVSGRPLVSAAAVGTDGQLTVYHYGEDGPCYRCLFPESPAPENCSRCADAGVLGVVPGIMGSLQALEAIKIISQRGDVMSKKLLIFDALAGRFSTVKLRGRRASCVSCGDAPELTHSSLPTFNYELFTGQEARDGPPVPLQLLSDAERMSPLAAQAALDDARASGRPFVLLDVRPELQYKLMHLPEAWNIPVELLEQRMEEVRARCGAVNQEQGSGQQDGQGSEVSAPASTGRAQVPVFVYCRRGNASQLAVQQLRQAGITQAVDVVGGMTAWAHAVDPTMPVL
mmetsp:Transcript_21339/g.46623  ORF Transcript_21339/g.46623 Transcript_21339/m.46623 type:complete len:498 (+) Transcript_21339:37-1530(+)